MTDKDYLSSLNFGWDRGDKENVRKLPQNVRHWVLIIKSSYFLTKVHGDKIEYVDERYAAGEKSKRS